MKQLDHFIKTDKHSKSFTERELEWMDNEINTNPAFKSFRGRPVIRKLDVNGSSCELCGSTRDLSITAIPLHGNINPKEGVYCRHCIQSYKEGKLWTHGARDPRW